MSYSTPTPFRVNTLLTKPLPSVLILPSPSHSLSSPVSNASVSLPNLTPSSPTPIIPQMPPIPPLPASSLSPPTVDTKIIPPAPISSIGSDIPQSLPHLSTNILTPILIYATTTVPSHLPPLVSSTAIAATTLPLIPSSPTSTPHISPSLPPKRGVGSIILQKAHLDVL